MRRFFSQRWFLTSLLLCLSGALAFCEQLAWLPRATPKDAVLLVVMLATAISTNFRAALAARASWAAVGLALLVNSCVAPPLGWLFGRWLPPLLGQGVIVAMSVPCTVAAAIVWTRRGGGNDAAAALASMISNVGCFLVLPFWTGLLLSADSGDQLRGFSPPNLALKLLLVVALPMLAGQALRLAPSIADWADRRKTRLGLVAQLGVLLMATLGAIEAGLAMLGAAYRPDRADWLRLGATVVALHLTLLAVAWGVSRAARLGRADRLAVIIAGSQKSMAVGVGVALQFGPMSIFPLITYHFVQLLIDTLVADRARRVAAEERAGDAGAA